MKLYHLTDAASVAIIVFGTIALFTTGDVDMVIVVYLAAALGLVVSIILEKGTKP